MYSTLWPKTHKHMTRDRLKLLFFPHDSKPQHFKALDGLRGIAVLFVLLSHASNDNVFIHESLNLQRVGKIGVYLFFVLSAYLLDRQIALAFMYGKSSLSYWKNYALRRFLRIYPLFVIALLVYGFLTLIGIKTAIDTPLDIPLHMLLIRGESIFWSIPVEFKYYFISPLIMWFCHRFLKWDLTKIFLLLLFIVASAILLQSCFHLPIVSTIRYFPIFIVGTFISIFELISKPKHHTKFISTFFGVISFLVILVTIPYYFEKIFGFKVNFHSSEFYLLFAILWGLILLSAKHGIGLMRSLLESIPLRFIGSISFSMYLFHVLFLKFVQKLWIHPSAQIYVFFLLTIIFSSISFLVIEKPLSKIRIR